MTFQTRNMARKRKNLPLTLEKQQDDFGIYTSVYNHG